jgi:hypothetical protein
MINIKHNGHLVNYPERHIAATRCPLFGNSPL